MYRIHFDFIDVVLANTNSLKTMAEFTTLWNKKAINKGEVGCSFYSCYFRSYSLFKELRKNICSYIYNIN